MKWLLKISYSWGDEEPYQEFNSFEEAWDTAKRMLVMKQKQHPLKLMMKPVKQDLHLKKRKIADELVCITHMITAIVIMMCCLKKLQRL